MSVRQETERMQECQPLAVAVCSLAIIAAMVIGVGVFSHLLLRHIVQTLPLWIPVILGLRRSQAAGWAALPSFAIWFSLMSLIWLYLLGLSTLMSGHFTGLEIAMTIVTGAAAATGIVAALRLRSDLRWGSRVGIFLALAVVQLACLRISFLPVIAHR